MPLNSKYIIQTVLDKTGITQFKRSIEDVVRTTTQENRKLVTSSRVVGDNYKNLGKVGNTSFRQVNRTVVDANGHLKTLSFTQGKVNGVWATFNNTVRQSNGIVGTFNKSIRGSTAGLLGAARRALVVIPVWFALRRIMTGFSTSVREGVTHIIDFDKAMARAKAVMTGTNQEVEAFSERLEVVARQLAGQTGTEINNVIELFYRMATAGLDNEEALAGMNIALKTSIGIMGDATDTAVLLADIYNLMGDRIEGAIGPTEKMQKIAGTIAILWDDNAFTLDEFTSALANFVPTAKNYNLTLDETLGITATAATLMSRGASAGTQLSRALIQLRDNADAVERVLGRQVNFADTRPYDLLVEVLESLAQKFQETGDIASDVIDIFGIKGSKTIQSFSSDLGPLVRNMKELSETDVASRVEKLTEKFNLQVGTLDRQLKRISEYRKQTVEAFLQGITGAANYEQALRGIADFMEQKLIPLAFALAETLRLPVTLFKNLANTIGDESPLKELFAQANPNLSREPVTGEFFGAGFTNPLADTELDTAFKDFKQQLDAIEGASNQIKFIQEKLGVSFQEAIGVGYLNYIDAAQAQFDNFIGAVQDRGGLSASSDALEKEKRLREEINNIKADGDSKAKLETAEQLILAEKLLALGYSELDVERQKLSILEQRGAKSEEIAKQEQKILEIEIQQINEISKSLQDAFEQGLSDVFQGEGDFFDLFERVGRKIRETISDALAETITEQIFTSTGAGAIFGDLIGGIRSGADRVKQKEIEGHTEGAEILYDRITQAHADGAKAAMTLIDGSVGDVDGNPLGGGSGGSGGLGGLLNKRFFAKEGAAKNAGLLQGGGIDAGGALALFGAFQTAQSLNKNAPGSGDVFGSALTGASAGASAGFALGGPLGAAIGAGIGAIFGGIQGARSKTTVETDEQTLRVASKIDVTNKKLDIINRNFVALKTNIETYILPDTAYFSTNRNLEDNFSINARRGFT